VAAGTVRGGELAQPASAAAAAVVITVTAIVRFDVFMRGGGSNRVAIERNLHLENFPFFEHAGSAARV
jgi:hypothetical protein